MPSFNLLVNRKKYTVDVDPTTPILWVLRDHLDLVGTKFGCGVGSCGACTIHFNGNPIRSCQIPVSAAVGLNITTIEGLPEKEALPLKKAWTTHDVPQCGYCQAGQIMSAAALLKRNPKPTDKDIDDAMNGNLCRCATYTRIRAAIKSASQKA